MVDYIKYQYELVFITSCCHGRSEREQCITAVINICYDSMHICAGYSRSDLGYLTMKNGCGWVWMHFQCLGSLALLEYQSPTHSQRRLQLVLMINPSMTAAPICFLPVWEPEQYQSQADWKLPSCCHCSRLNWCLNDQCFKHSHALCYCDEGRSHAAVWK